MSLCEKLGLDKDIYSVSIPLGATINMDGAAIYMGIAAIFAAEVYGIPMPLDRQLTVILLAVLASIGSMGVPGAALIMITMVFTQVGIPLEAIALVAGVDRIMDMARTTINVLGDATGALFVSKLESDFDPEAESPVGALGLMQMMPETFDWMQTHIGGEYDASALLDPEISIKYGCALLRVLLNEYDNLATAVCAYNAGMGNVTSWLSDPAYSEDGVTLKEIPFEETRLYVQKVLQYKETYEKLYGGIENG